MTLHWPSQADLCPVRLMSATLFHPFQRAGQVFFHLLHNLPFLKPDVWALEENTGTINKGVTCQWWQVTTRCQYIHSIFLATLRQFYFISLSRSLKIKYYDILKYPLWLNENRKDLGTDTPFVDKCINLHLPYNKTSKHGAPNIIHQYFDICIYK